MYSGPERTKIVNITDTRKEQPHRAAVYTAGGSEIVVIDGVKNGQEEEK